jgi:predicted DNA-binding protein (MmcQ/YjbR family)
LTYDEFNEYCESLTATSHVVQWGDAHVWKVGTKVFAIGGWEKLGEPAFTFKATEADYFSLQDEPGFRAAPYMASRGMKWLQIYDGSEVSDEDIRHYLDKSYRIVSSSLTKKMQKALGLDESKA